jgi:hypothetical protein
MTGTGIGSTGSSRRRTAIASDPASTQIRRGRLRNVVSQFVGPGTWGSVTHIL